MSKNKNCPKIIKKVADFLKDNNHSCVEILHDRKKKSYELYWCMKDDCVLSHSLFGKSNQIPKIMKKLCDFLKKNNHECCSIIGTSNHEFEWCMKDICEEKLMIEDMARRQAEEDAFVEKLVREGHTCIYIMESYPSQTGWCEQKVCINLA
uniref:Uncharacterized protein n=1 Tax=Borely moumouvirus TaxID=2712067 RepID=A0A6G6ACS9_9VIRU